MGGVPIKENVLALPASSGSCHVSSSSSWGLVPIICFPISTSAKVPHPKKKHDNKGESTLRTKDKHQIKKMPSDLIFDDLMKVRYKNGILPHLGVMPIPRHLCDVDDPLAGW